MVQAPTSGAESTITVVKQEICDEYELREVNPGILHAMTRCSAAESENTVSPGTQTRYLIAASEKEVSETHGKSRGAMQGT